MTTAEDASRDLVEPGPDGLVALRHSYGPLWEPGGTEPAAARPGEVRYLSSHIGYSLFGEIITWTSIPVGTACALAASQVGGLAHWILYFGAYTLLVVWLVGKAAGPGRWPWFYRQPGTVTFSPDGVDWRSHSLGTPHSGHTPWSEIAGVASKAVRLSLVGHDGQIVGRIRPDLMRLRPDGRAEDWSFAQALVAYRPHDYVLTDLKLYRQPAGARRRLDGESASQIETQRLSRAPQVSMALLVAAIGLVAIVEALLRR